MSKNANWLVLGVMILVLIIFSCASKSQKSKIFLQDNAGLFKPHEQKSLDSLLNNYEKTTNSEIFVYTIDKIPDSFSRNEYGSQLVNRLGVGKPGLNNGAVIFLSVQDKIVEIRLAHGFEWNINKSQSESIVQKMIGFFSNAEFYNGAVYGVNQVIDLSKSSGWSLCSGTSNNKCVSKISIKKVIEKQNGFMMVETDELKQLKLNYTEFMMDLTDKIANKESISIYCRFISDNEANLLGVN